MLYACFDALCDVIGFVPVVVVKVKDPVLVKQQRNRAVNPMPVEPTRPRVLRKRQNLNSRIR